MAREVRVAILGDSRDFSRAVRDARNDADRLDGSFSRVGDGAARMGRAVALGAAAAATGAAALAVGFIRAAEESQQVSRQTEAVIRSMGNASNITAGQVAALSTQLSLKSGIDDELIQSGQNVLLTFGRVRNEVGRGNNVFDRATAAALDMSVALGTDMTAAAMQVGKALNDPIRGLAALRRSGIQFTEQQEDQIRAMVEVGNVAGAQRVMLEELERQFGGSAEAQATASGRIRVAWGNIQEQIGTALLPAFEAAATWLTNSLPGALSFAGGIVDDLKGKWETFTTAVFGPGDWETFWTNVQLGWVDAQTKWTAFTTDVKAKWEEFTTALFGDIDWDQFWSDVHAGMPEAEKRIGGFAMWFNAKWDNMWQNNVEYMQPFKDSIVWLFTNLGRLAGVIESTFSQLGNFLGINGNSAEEERVAEYLRNYGVDPYGVLPMPTGMGPFQVPQMGPIATLPNPNLRTPIAGPFADGGIMPGPWGKHSLALVAGGETILPTHKTGARATPQIVQHITVGGRASEMDGLVTRMRMKSALDDAVRDLARSIP